MTDRFLRADGREDLRIRVQVHAEAASVPGGHGATEVGKAVGLGVAMGGGLADGLLHATEDVLRSGHVRVTNGQ